MLQLNPRILFNIKIKCYLLSLHSMFIVLVLPLSVIDNFNTKSHFFHRSAIGNFSFSFFFLCCSSILWRSREKRRKEQRAFLSFFLYIKWNSSMSKLQMWNLLQCLLIHRKAISISIKAAHARKRKVVSVNSI